MNRLIYTNNVTAFATVILDAKLSIISWTGNQKI